MKKLFLFAALAVAAMTGCSDDKQVGEKGQVPGNEIGFRSVTKKNSDPNSRATEVDITNIRDFKVFGFWNNSFDFMYDVNVVRGDGSTWSYSPLRYWPMTGDVDFYAYSPAGSRGIVGNDMFTVTDTDPVISYVVPAANALQEDFLVTAAKTQNKDTNGGEVQLTFDHALSQLVFEARSAVQDVVFNVSAIEITGMQTTGEIDLGNIASGWTLDADAISNYSAPINTLPIIYNSDATKFTRITGPNDGLMIMPQELTPRLGDGTDLTGGGAMLDEPNNIPDDYEADPETIYLVVTYSAQLNSGVVIVPAGTKVYLPLTNVPGQEFVMGKKYIFQLSMSTGLTPIVFKVLGVTDWDDEEVSL